MPEFTFQTVDLQAEGVGSDMRPVVTTVTTRVRLPTTGVLMTSDQAFTVTVQKVLVDEGGLINDPRNDPNGGLTNFGISQKQNPDVNVATLTRDEAIAIYKARYWELSGADRTPWPLSFLLFDSAVNQGVVTAVTLLQKALGVSADGRFGPATVAAIAAREPWELTARFVALRLQRYVSTSNYPANGQGWFYRVAKNMLDAGRASTA